MGRDSINAIFHNIGGINHVSVWRETCLKNCSEKIFRTIPDSWRISFRHSINHSSGIRLQNLEMNWTVVCCCCFPETILAFETSTKPQKGLWTSVMSDVERLTQKSASLPSHFGKNRWLLARKYYDIAEWMENTRSTVIHQFLYFESNQIWHLHPSHEFPQIKWGRNFHFHYHEIFKKFFIIKLGGTRISWFSLEGK